DAEKGKDAKRRSHGFSPFLGGIDQVANLPERQQHSRIAASYSAARAPRAATMPPRRRAWLRIFVVRCSLPCDPLVGGHSCNGGMNHASIARSRPRASRHSRVSVRSSWWPKANVHIHGVPT